MSNVDQIASIMFYLYSLEAADRRSIPMISVYLILILLSVIFIIFGTLHFIRKPLLFSSYSFILLLFLPLFLVPIVLIILSPSFSIFLIIPIGIITILIFVAKWISGDYMLINVGKEELYASVYDILDQKSINFEEGPMVYEHSRYGSIECGPKILLPSLNSEIILKPYWNIARIKFKLREKKYLKIEIIEDLKKRIENLAPAKYSYVGLVFIAVGAFLLVIFGVIFYQIESLNRIWDIIFLFIILG